MPSASRLGKKSHIFPGNGHCVHLFVAFRGTVGTALLLIGVGVISFSLLRIYIFLSLSLSLFKKYLDV